MRKELPKVYDPRQVEPRIYQMWMDGGCFKAEPNPDIVIRKAFRSEGYSKCVECPGAARWLPLR